MHTAGSTSRAPSSSRSQPAHAAAAEAAPSPDLTTDPSLDLSSALSLDNIRQTLIRLEDTIIFSLIERAQFARNKAVYEAGAIPVPGFQADGRRYSLLEYLLREIEQVRGPAAGLCGTPQQTVSWIASPTLQSAGQAPTDAVSQLGRVDALRLCLRLCPA